MAWRKIVILCLLFPSSAVLAQEIYVKGRVVDPQGNTLARAVVQLLAHNQVLAEAIAGPEGEFQMKVGSAGEFVVKVAAAGFRPVSRLVTVRASGNSAIEISMGQVSSRIENVTVTADVNESDVLSPDPGERVFVRQDLLDANPGRPGAPVSIPGNRIERHKGSTILRARRGRRSWRTDCSVYRRRRLSQCLYGPRKHLRRLYLQELVERFVSYEFRKAHVVKRDR
jgi:Carboxypeptidase regulatory-like domain